MSAVFVANESNSNFVTAIKKNKNRAYVASSLLNPKKKKKTELQYGHETEAAVEKTETSTNVYSGVIAWLMMVN